MTGRPVVWALGMAGLALLGALHYGPQLARMSGLDDPPGAAVAGAPGRSMQPAAETRSQPGEPATLTVAANYSGHYIVHPTIDNYRIRMMVDTGATLVALTASDARALGLRLEQGDYRARLSTANGVVRAARVNLREIRLGSILVRNVEAVVLPEGALGVSLLGASFLGKLRGYEVQTGRMVLRG